MTKIGRRELFPIRFSSRELHEKAAKFYGYLRQICTLPFFFVFHLLLGDGRLTVVTLKYR